MSTNFPLMQVNRIRIERSLGRAETTCNRCDHIPIISTLSGALRIAAAFAQVAAGIAFACYKTMHALLDGQCSTFEQTFIGFSHCLHGAANLIRGSIALIPGINLTLLLYDRYIGRMNYIREPINYKFYPLAPCTPNLIYENI